MLRQRLVSMTLTAFRNREVTVGLQYFAPVPSFRGSPAWSMDPSDSMGDLDAEVFPLFPFFFSVHPPPCHL